MSIKDNNIPIIIKLAGQVKALKDLSPRPSVSTAIDKASLGWINFWNISSSSRQSVDQIADFISSLPLDCLHIILFSKDNVDSDSWEEIKSKYGKIKIVTVDPRLEVPSKNPSLVIENRVSNRIENKSVDKEKSSVI